MRKRCRGCYEVISQFEGSVIAVAALGSFIEGIFAEGNIAKGVFAERNFRRMEFSPNGSFAEKFPKVMFTGST